jgi:Xaa-Pro aminopeptidase
MRHKSSVSPQRIQKVLSRLNSFNVDAVLFLDIKNVRYLTGFTGSDGALLIGKRQKLLMVDGRYTNQAKREVHDVEIFQYREKIEGIEAVISDNSLKSVGFESTAMNVTTFLKLKKKLKAVKLTPMSHEIDTIRAVKDTAEIAYIRKAGETASKALRALSDFIKPGVSEKDIAVELDYRMAGKGAEQVSFSTIVASGVNSSQPHASPGSRKIKNGDIVMIDYGAVCNGYHSDETCTFIVGRTNKKQKEVYSLVKEAHDRALAAVKAGATCKEIDHIARTCVEGENMGKYFTHGTGHGVGLDVHEAPRIADKSEHILEAGMVVTIEPGVYIPDLWGVRIEDMVLVKKDGFEVLTKVPKDLTVLQ